MAGTRYRYAIEARERRAKYWRLVICGYDLAWVFRTWERIGPAPRREYRLTVCRNA